MFIVSGIHTVSSLFQRASSMFRKSSLAVRTLHIFLIVAIILPNFTWTVAATTAQDSVSSSEEERTKLAAIHDKKVYKPASAANYLPPPFTRPDPRVGIRPPLNPQNMIPSNGTALYVGSDSIPKFEILASCDPYCSQTWTHGNIFAFTLDEARGYVFQVTILGTIIKNIKRMACDRPADNPIPPFFGDPCDGADTMWPLITEQLELDDNHCFFNGYAWIGNVYGDFVALCPLIAPGASYHNGWGDPAIWPADAGTYLSGGFETGWPGYSQFWITDFHFIYGGPGPELPEEMTGSCGQPKNGTTDPRGCPVNGGNGASGLAGDPINTHTGGFDYNVVDMTMNTPAGPLSFERFYNSRFTYTQTYTTTLGLG
ncbi:MAG TPA: DUF6531 domain-containing protein, partial [Anaerolineales bacterium]|nr:DUF6531 domain-containing protein [Anaerolineales bacterium]